MKRFLTSFLAICLFASTSFGACDFSTGITKQPDGNYLYTKECHVAVGEMKYDLGIKDKQLEEFRKAIGLKDTALALAEQRTQLWMDTSFKMNDRLNTIENMRSTNNWMYYGLGALTVLATGFMVAELNKSK